MEIIKPNYSYGRMDVGIFSLSNKDDVSFPKRYKRAIKNLNKICGHVYEWKNEESASIQLINMFKSDNINMLMSLTGGYTTNIHLDSINYKEVAKNPKIVVGYSDTTALLFALYTKIKLVTFYGPALIGTFGEYPDINSYTIKTFNDIMTYTDGVYTYKEPETQSMSNYFWDREDEKDLDYYKFEGWKSNNKGMAKGILVGGNLSTILSLLGTEYMPDFKDKILFIEDAFTSPQKFNRDIETLKQNKILYQINGIIVGTFFGVDMNQSCFEKILNEYIDKPMIYNVNFGHSNPIMTIPIGISAEIDSNKPRITLLESPFKKAHSGIA